MIELITESPYLAGYIYGATVYSITVLQKVNVDDFIASIMIGLLWPVHFPGIALRKIVK